ncbi:MAG: NAD(P)-dependent oxidoreductase [Oscillospiraceae bacterium]
MKTFAVVGTDKRQAAAAEYLKKIGFTVYTAEGVHMADYILLPMPLTGDNVSQTQLLYAAKKNALAFAGKVSVEALEISKGAKVEIIDYFKRDDLAMLNAIPTVEGAIEIVLAARNRTLWQSQIIVTGFGRIARLLCHHLKAFGANVTVCARAAKDRAEAIAFGYNGATISNLPQICTKADILINTVPALIVDEKALRNLSLDALVVDLASVPGGIDTVAVQALGINYKWALSLPAKTAPLTAGEFVIKTVLEIITERDGEPF